MALKLKVGGDGKYMRFQSTYAHRIYTTDIIYVFCGN